MQNSFLKIAGDVSPTCRRLQISTPIVIVWEANTSFKYDRPCVKTRLKYQSVSQISSQTAPDGGKRYASIEAYSL